MVRRFLLAIVLCFVLLLGARGGIVQAQNNPPPQSAQNPENQYGYQITTEEINAFNEATADCSAPSLECLVRNTTRFVAIEWLNDIVGYPVTFDAADPTPGGSLNVTSPVAARTGGAADGLVSLITGMYAYQPAATSRYVADVLDNAGVSSPAYAQGLGFASLDPILSLWKSFRNVAYFFFIAVIIVIGIMIMLRQKISAQASVTAQQALPNIIIALILVTFSYAISGILIDVMYLSMYMIVGLFNTISPNGVGTEMISMNIFNLAGMLFRDQFSNTGDNMNLITSVMSSMLTQDGNASWWTGFAGFLGGLTLSIVLAVAVLIGMIKLFLELLKSYASIIMGVVFAPIYLMMGAFPGTNSFTPWFKNMVGNLAAFPTTLLFVIIYQIFTTNISENGQGGFMPPYLIGNGQSGIAGYIMGLAILLALPEIVKEVKKKMGAADGGFGWMVATAGGRNFGKAADLGLPIGAATVEGSRRGVVGGYSAIRTGGQDYGGARGLWRGITEGVTTTTAGKKTTRGGASRGISAGFAAGQRGRKIIDDIQDGRLFEPDNWRRQLERLEQGQKQGAGGKNTETSSAPKAPLPSHDA